MAVQIVLEPVCGPPHTHIPYDRDPCLPPPPMPKHNPAASFAANLPSEAHQARLDVPLIYKRILGSSHHSQRSRKPSQGVKAPCMWRARRAAWAARHAWPQRRGRHKGVHANWGVYADTRASVSGGGRRATSDERRTRSDERRTCAFSTCRSVSTLLPSKGPCKRVLQHLNGIQLSLPGGKRRTA